MKPLGDKKKKKKSREISFVSWVYFLENLNFHFENFISRRAEIRELYSMLCGKESQKRGDILDWLFGQPSIYTHSWFTLLFCRYWHKIVEQLYSNKMQFQKGRQESKSNQCLYKVQSQISASPQQKAIFSS